MSFWTMAVYEVSTHMPLARHDKDYLSLIHFFYEFLLTCLLRGMTECRKVFCDEVNVSTHMPLARHDITDNTTIDATSFLLTCLLRGMTLGV